MLRKIKLHWWILAGVVLGASLGSAMYSAYVDEARDKVLAFRVAPLTRGFHPSEFTAGDDDPYAFAKARKLPVKSLVDYLAVVDARIGEAKKKGALCLNMTFAEGRAEPSANVSNEEAAKSFGTPKGELSESAVRDFQDFMVWRLVELSVKHDLPFRDGGQALLADVVKANPKARVIPGPGYTEEDGVRNAGQVNVQIAKDLKPSNLYQAFYGIKTIFLKLLKMIVIPLVFFSLASGIAGMGSLKRLGKIGAKTFSWYIMTSLIAIVTGLVIVNIFQPGVGTDLQIPLELEKELPPPPETFWDVLIPMVPQNPVEAMATFDLIGVIVFTLLFSICMLAVDETKRASLTGFLEAGASVMMKLTHFVICLAPVGVAALIAEIISKTGPSVFINLFGYIVTIAASLGTHFLVTLPLLIWFFTRRNPYRYMNAMAPALVTAFSTASSSGTLGVTMERAEKGAGISNRITSFVLPIGATINMDGTALYEIVTVLFIAQVHAGIDPNFTLTFAQQILICFIGLMVSIGAAGIPHAGLVMMVIILEAVGLPLAYTALIWSVDRPLDMTRTMTNVWSDSSVTLVMGHTEKEVDESVLFSRPK